MSRFTKGAPRTVVLLVVAFAQHVAWGQDPASAVRTGFTVPLVDEAHCKAWREFRRLLGERQWSMAFRMVSDDLEHPPQGLLPSEDDISQAWRTQVRQDLGGLDAEGRRAFDLFFGGRARQLVDAALAKNPDDASREAELETAFHAYGLTPAGTRGGDLVATAALQSGNDAEAVEIWEWILKSGSTDGCDPRRVRLGLCRAFAHLGKRDDFNRVAVALEERWGDDAIEEDGVSMTVRERVARVRATLPPVVESAGAPRLVLPTHGVIGWESAVPEAPQKERRQLGRARRVFMRGGAGDDNFPAPLEAAVDGTLLYVSDGRRLRAIDVTSAEVKWNRAHHWEASGSVGPWIVPSGDAVFVEEFRESGRHFSCREASDGSPRWVADLGLNEDCMGEPLVESKNIYAVLRETDSQRITLAAIAPSNGRKRWTANLGTIAAAWNTELPLQYMICMTPEVCMVRQGSHIIVFAGGSALSVDPVRRSLRWATVLDTSAGPYAECSGRFHVFREGSVAYVAFPSGQSLVAFDMDRAKRCWRRVIGKGFRLEAMDRDRFYFVGNEICAYSRQDRSLQWARPVGRSRPRFLETRDHLYYVQSGALREISKSTGDDVSVLRGDHEFFKGGHLSSTPAGLVCVSSSMISLLRLSDPEGEGPATVPKIKEGQ